MDVFDDDASAYKLDAEIKAKAQEHKMQNLGVYAVVNSLMIALQLLGGWAGYTFFGNIFLGLTIIMGLVCVMIVTFTENKLFARTHISGWWNYVPVGTGLISLGFGWYFTWLVWWGIFVAMMWKKDIGDAELKAEARKEKDQVEPIQRTNDPIETVIVEHWNDYKDTGRF